MGGDTLKPEAGIRGASGAAICDQSLLVVSDDSPNYILRARLPRPLPHRFAVPHGAVERVELVSGAGAAGGLALDLESIDVLADGRVVALSERLRCLIGAEGIVAQYDDPFSEVGERGLEGLAVRDAGDQVSTVAVLWEGGYLLESELPIVLADLADRLLPPVVFIHDLGPGQVSRKFRAEAGSVIPLRPPAVESAPAEGPPLGFRAPDLVWHAWTNESGDREWGFIVLLSSEAPPYKPRGPQEDTERRYGPRWLQRFDLSGEPVGAPLDIDREVRALTGSEDLDDANWEGLAWSEPGATLLLVHDAWPSPITDPQVITLPIPADWRE